MLGAAIGAGTATLIGSLIRGALSGGDDYVQDKTRVHEAAGLSPTRDPYGSEADRAQQRIGAVGNPWILGALADQGYMRNQQQGYIDKLMAQASGAKSYAAEESARAEAERRGSLLTMGNSTRDRFAQAGTSQGAMQELAGLHQNMLLPTELAMSQERNQAQDMLTRVLMGQRQQDLQGQDAWRRQRDLGDRRRLLGAAARYGHHQLAGRDQRSQTSEETGFEDANARDARR